MKVQINMYSKITALVIVASILQLPAAGEFYDSDVINTIEMTFADDNWNADLDAIYKQDFDGDEDYDRLLCTVIINGEQYDNVGVRYKGNSSYRDGNAKKPFNIKLDHIISQYYEGYGTVKLSNVYKDPSFVRETLSYEIARKYMDASQANYMKVYIYNHGAGQYDYHGLYTNVEAVDKKFLSEHYYSDDNARFKCNPSDAWSPGGGSNGASLEYLGGDPSLYYGPYQLKSNDPNDWYDLVDLTYDLANNSQDLDSAVDLDRTVWMLAFNNILVNLDSYTGPTRQNFYLYKGNDDRWIPTVWDLNECIGVFTRIDQGGGGPPSATSDNDSSDAITFTLTELSDGGPPPPPNNKDLIEMDPLLRQGDAAWPLLNLILANPTYQKMYIAHMRTILEENFSNGWYIARATEIQGVIDSDVQADANKLYSYDDFINNIADTRSGSIGIVELMDARVAYLNTHSSLLAAAPAITNITVSPNNPSSNSSVWINADINNANSVTLAYRHNNSDKFQNILMSDNGDNNDGGAGDGVYGVSLSVTNTDIQYYIYVENDNAAMFSPQRAEHEFYTINVTPTFLVINEFMADNESTVQDPDGGVGYPDWIELYNPGSTTVDLGGMYLTDNLSAPDQWRIPDGISVASGGYLLFWADDDEDQGDMHTNFKLDKSGEAIGLYDADSNDNELIDFITFGSQSEDVSYGRVGDGSDNWRSISCPSPGLANPPVSDLDGNCAVDLTDFALFGLHWQDANRTQYDGADISGDENVDMDDLLIFSTDWLKGP